MLGPLKRVLNTHDHYVALADVRFVPHEAIAQYDVALKLNPKLAGALYGRGVAKQRKGDAAGGSADLAAAKAIQANEFALRGEVTGKLRHLMIAAARQIIRFTSAAPPTLAIKADMSERPRRASSGHRIFFSEPGPRSKMSICAQRESRWAIDRVSQWQPDEYGR